MGIDSGWGFLAYVALKYLAYVMWCYVGVGMFRDERTLKSAAGLGAVRLLLGIGFGIGVFIVGGMMHLETQQDLVLLYLKIYVPIRWIEWGIMAALLSRADRGAVALLAGQSWRSRFWRVGGILVSIFADLPVLLSSSGPKEMLPVGRFLC